MPRRVPIGFVPLLLLLVLCASAAEPSVEFNRDVRPILADHCFQCHGPDANQRQADLRLDMPEAAAANREGGPVVVAGQPDQSELWRRITSADADERMPPPDKGRKLTDSEVTTLKQWILNGARFEKHWSLLPIDQPTLPQVAGTHRVPLPHDGTRSVPTTEFATGPLDTFILARLQKT